MGSRPDAPAVQPAPLTISVGLWRQQREGIPGRNRVGLLIDKALGSGTWVLAFLSQLFFRGCS